MRTRKSARDIPEISEEAIKTAQQIITEYPRIGMNNTAFFLGMDYPELRGKIDGSDLRRILEQEMGPNYSTDRDK